MPSSTVTPKRSRKRVKVSAGSGSAADTPRRTEAKVSSSMAALFSAA
jgi:hypothetical protein